MMNCQWKCAMLTVAFALIFVATPTGVSAVKLPRLKPPKPPKPPCVKGLRTCRTGIEGSNFRREGDPLEVLIQVLKPQVEQQQIERELIRQTKVDLRRVERDIQGLQAQLEQRQALVQQGKVKLNSKQRGVELHEAEKAERGVKRIMDWQDQVTQELNRSRQAETERIAIQRCIFEKTAGNSFETGVCDALLYRVPRGRVVYQAILGVVRNSAQKTAARSMANRIRAVDRADLDAMMQKSREAASNYIRKSQNYKSWLNSVKWPSPHEPAGIHVQHDERSVPAKTLESLFERYPWKSPTQTLSNMPVKGRMSDKDKAFWKNEMKYFVEEAERARFELPKSNSRPDELIEFMKAGK
jgi:hypothetical protein